MRIRLDIPLSIKEIVKALGALPSDLSTDIEYIVTDTREASKNDLFFALEGKESSGEAYLSDAIEKGAIPVTATTRYGGLHVKDTKEALLSLAAYYLTRLEKLKERICITGSVGKTTTKEFLSKILSYEYKVHSTIKNFNNEIGVPLTVLSSPKDVEILVLELGTNHRGEIGRLSRAVRPTMAIITNVGTSHIGNLGSKAQIALEKASITEGMADKSRIFTEYGESLFEGIISGSTVSMESSLSNYHLMPIAEDINGTTFDFFSDTVMLSGVRFNLPGRHILSCLAFSISAALKLGMKKDNITLAVSSLGSEHVRHKLVKMNGYAILDDSYNASRESVIADFRFLQFYKNYPLAALLGDILELGRDAESIHRELGALAYRYGLSQLYLFGAYSIFTAEGAISEGMSPKNIFLNTDTQNPEKTAEDIYNYHKENEIILFKASHKMNLAQIIDILKSKGRSEKDA